MYLMLNVENLKLYEPPLIMDVEEVGQVPAMDYFTPEYLEKLPNEIILDRNTKTSLWGDVEYLRIGLKGMHPSKAQWMEKEKVREKFPRFPID